MCAGPGGGGRGSMEMRAPAEGGGRQRQQQQVDEGRGSPKGEDLRRAKAEGCGLGCERAAQTRRDEQQGRAPRSWRYENANARNVLGEL